MCCTVSAASNLVTGDTNGTKDVFLFDRMTGTTERVSVGVGGVQGDGDSVPRRPRERRLTPRYVAFVSSASNLVPGDVNGKADVFVRDRVAGTTTLVSRASGVNGAAGNDDSFQVSVSDNGRYVAFSSSASNLVAGDTNNVGRMCSCVTLSRTRPSGCRWVSWVRVAVVRRCRRSRPTVGSWRSTRMLMIWSRTTTTCRYDVFVRDRLSGSTERVSVGPNGEQGADDSTDPSMSRDGRYIAFESAVEPEFDRNDGNLSLDAYVRDRLARNTVRASEKSNDLDAFADANDAAISPEGQFVGFDTDSADYSRAVDTNDDYDVYIKDLSHLLQQRHCRQPLSRRRAEAAARHAHVQHASSSVRRTRDLQVTGGTTGIPADATAVVLNVTSTEATTRDGLRHGRTEGRPRHRNVEPQPPTGSHGAEPRDGQGGHGRQRQPLHQHRGGPSCSSTCSATTSRTTATRSPAIQPSRILDTRGRQRPRGLAEQAAVRRRDPVSARWTLPVAGVGDVPA